MLSAVRTQYNSKVCFIFKRLLDKTQLAEFTENIKLYFRMKNLDEARIIISLAARTRSLNRE